MASSPGTPTTSAPFELSKLLKTPTAAAAAAATSSPATPPPSSSGASPPPLSSGSPFSYAPAVPPILHHHHPFLHRPAAAPNPNPSPGSRVTQHLHAAAPIESAASQPPPSPSTPSTPPPPPPSPARVLSGKKPRGRRVGGGERAVHDVDWRMQGEAEPPQLEVTPITKYTSDPDLVLGRQIAVNRSYIVYGLKLGNIRVLNINTALRSLLRGHTQRVTDMAFFAEDVQLLASASADGRVFIWKIDEGPDKEDKPQITAKIVTAIQIVGDGESYHPRICWHSHKQEILFVGIGSIVLKIDTIKVGRGKGFSAEEPLKCPMEKLIDGVQLVGKHDGDVTDLSISQWMTTRLASASKDGTVKIWDERKAVALSTLRPHDGQAVNSVAFLTSPDRPDHINLVTAGPLSREVKIWASTSDEGWLLPSDSESWQCNQMLELRSTSESRLEEAFFNQVLILPRTSLLILANAKKNAIYAVHIDYSPCPASTCMDYIADFTVAMPILSLTATSDCPLDGEQVVQLYCVQTMAIQQYALDLSLCLPPPIDNAGIKRDPSNSRISNKPNSSEVAEPSLESPSSKPSPIEYANEKTITSTLSAVASATEITTSPVPLPFNPSGRLPSLRSSSQGSELGQSLGDHDTILTSASDASSVNNKSGRDETSAGQNRTDASFVPAAHVMFKVGGDTTHLVTPSEILSGAISSSEDNHVNQGLKCEEAKIQGVVADNNNERAEVEVKVVERSRSNEILELNGRKVPEVLQEEDNEKLPKSLESNSQMANTGPLLTDAHSVEESCFAEDSAIGESLEHSSVTGREADKSSSKDIMPEKFEESAVATASDSPLFDIEEQKAKKSQVPSTLSPSSSPYNSTDSPNEPGKREIVFSSDVALPQILAVQDALNQLVTMQKDMQMKLSDMVAVPVAKEGKRLEAALGRSMEKIVKANFDALWARFQEENAKREKIEKDRMQHIANVITNCINKDLPSVLERALKKEISALGPVVARALTPVIEKTISSTVADSFQRGVVDKAVNQLDKSLNSKLEASLTRQIQTQFQTSGRQALQDALKSSLESSVIPTFEQASKAMFEQIDAAFQKVMSERATAAQLEAAHTPLAIALRDAINSASSITQSFTAELVDCQHKLLALVAAGNTKAVNPIAVQTNNGHIAARPETAEAPLDPKRELSRLISEHKYEEAFMSALQRSDVSLVSWLCSQVDLRNICSTVPLRLNQGVLLALLQQLACDLANDTSQKVAWMTDVAVAINPADPMISLHVRPIFEQVYNMLGHQRSLPTTAPAESSNIRLLMHVVNSVLLSCK